VAGEVQAGLLRNCNVRLIERTRGGVLYDTDFSFVNIFMKQHLL
jgi:hypothetical protein